MTLRTANLSNLILNLSVAAGLLCAGVSASAQTTASITIPFAFSVDNQNVPAGSYRVEMLSDRFLSLRDKATNQTQIFLVRPELGQAIETRGRMVFQQAGSRKYLAQVWISGTSLHSEIAVQHTRGLESTKSKVTPPSTVELALK